MNLHLGNLLNLGYYFDPTAPEVFGNLDTAVSVFFLVLLMGATSPYFLLDVKHSSDKKEDKSFKRWFEHIQWPLITLITLCFLGGFFELAMHERAEGYGLNMRIWGAILFISVVINLVYIVYKVLLMYKNKPETKNEYRKTA